MGQVYSVKHQATSEVNQCQDETTSSMPANFPNAAFSLTPTFIDDSPYAKAMYMLIHISDRFDEPISIAARGNTRIDDDVIRADWRALKQAAFRYLISDNKCQPTPKRERRTGEPLSPMDHPMGF
ncbi:hypothetical protein FOXG_17889 [Fusarium oxysporum f. sp. lycopersici 4287]|uniref:Uncharacterized protein n=1 Tax=Fusarium oxysporum f. sp. lycopersici (strain 4287 / CBS 123668 / FGSC 9935 / NRRL 34936) TaxID=426428 RepID=A0A0J9U5M1_FUSO4|nr:hypothetical protein FOXG_17889 [Fusarium oxysporum f. sp. lycopersici 4287]KNA94498.1 hypothetical protein FOXG_17889 [Fusarium oxysporum f. sp. lycopersici 4287]